jgi:hypothetical protein
MRQGIISAIVVGIALTGSAPIVAQVKDAQVKTTPKQPLATPAEAKLIADFEARAQAYHDLRDKVDEGAARQTQTKEPEKLTAQRDTLRANIQKARANAKPGDIFTAEIQPFFKKLLKPALKGTDGQENKNAVKEEKPLVWLKPNAAYPEDQPLSTVPPDLIVQLPKLPKDMEYRFVKKHLILYDSRASLIVDFIYNAIP